MTAPVIERQKCPVCNNISTIRLTKGFVKYFQCHSCETLFCGDLPNDNMVGGGCEEERNVQQNGERIERLDQLLGGKRKGLNVLDFGCGSGMLVDDLNKAGYAATGFDVYNPLFSKLPPKNFFHACTMIEVVEHLSTPYIELELICRSLLPGGILMVETSFTDVAKEENIPLEDFFYIAPEAGHSTIFSHHGLDVLMCLKGFKPYEHFNRHSRIYLKR